MGIVQWDDHSRRSIRTVFYRDLRNTRSRTDSCFMERGFRASSVGYWSTSASHAGKARFVRPPAPRLRRTSRTEFKDRRARFRKRFLSGDYGSTFQVRLVDCHGHAHRSAGARIPLQCARDKGELELDAANAALDRAAAFQPQRADANAANPRYAGKRGASLNTFYPLFSIGAPTLLPHSVQEPS